ncbi:MAG: GxxExxY protein [Opitutaceae bacterium]|nr:GxxExxY protein [Opitutaceae bacterium]
MDTDKHGFNLPEGEQTHAIIGCAFEVLNVLGHGLHEKPYENAMVVELGIRNLSFEQQRRFEIRYKEVAVGEFIPDLIVGAAVVVDTKVIEQITALERGQMLNYLKITNLRVGLIINFKRPKLEWERIVL